jgi:hypothetical protein
MAQTLREFMQVAPPDEVFHVGCKKGSGYFFVGTPAEYFCAENDVAAYLQLKNQRALDKARSDVRNALDLLKKIKRIKTDDFFGEGFEDSMEMIELLQRHVKWSFPQSKRLPTLESRVETFVPPSDRKIWEVYDRCLNDGMAVIVTGFDIGEAWDAKEYNAVKVKMAEERSNA